MNPNKRPTPYAGVPFITDILTHVPYLYRYENQKWIDEFFSTGNIKLSSFAEYQSYEDEQLGDKHEGFSRLMMHGDNDTLISTGVQIGFKEYCFCLSTVNDESLKDTFSRNSKFQITDPLNFILEITKSMTRVDKVIHGHCLYLNDRIISEQISGLPNTTHTSHMINQMYFLKKTELQHQSEYRIIWFTDRDVKDSTIFHCPEARKYCDQLKS
jgi:hypothetical protein